MMNLLLSFGLLIACVMAQDLFKHCDYVEHLDCSTFNQAQVCGSDGMTYRGKCALAVAHCKNKGTHLAHEGPCSSSHSTPAPTGSGSSLVQSIFCQAVEHIDCSTHIKQPVCATNGKRFESMCIYEQARCHDNSLHLRPSC